MDNPLTNLTMTEAADLLDVSRFKLRNLVKDGTLPARQNPLDRREWLIPRAAVLRLRTGGRAPAKWNRTPRSKRLVAGEEESLAT